MLDKLAEVEKRYEELERLMSDPQLLGQQREYSKLAKERSELEEIVSRYREWRRVEQEIQDNRQLLEENDEAIRELAKEEAGVLRQRKEDIPNLMSFFLTKYARDFRRPVPQLSQQTQRLFQDYSWPGNIRELEDAAKAIVERLKLSLPVPAEVSFDVPLGGRGSHRVLAILGALYQ